MADYTKIVDPDNGPGTDYLSLNAWEAGEQTAYSDGDVAIADCRRTGSTDDTSDCYIAGWTAGVEARIVGNLAYDRYRLIQNTDYRHAIRAEIATVSIYNLDISNSPSLGPVDGIHTASGSTMLTVERCRIFECNRHGIVNNGNTVTIRNCEIYDNANTGVHSTWGFATPTTNVYNCTISGNATGVDRQSGTLTVTNSANFNNTTDWTGTITATYCASDDYIAGSGNIQWISESVDWDTNFTDYANGDFSLKPTAPDLIDNGTDLSASGVTDDIIGEARPTISSGWDIGAFHQIEVIRTVKTTGGDYTSLNAWEVGQQSDLVSENKRRTAECYAMQDTISVTFDGWTTSSTRYIKAYTPVSGRHDGKWNTSKYYLRVQGSWSIATYEQFLILEGIQAEVTEAWVSPRRVFTINNSNASNGQIEINSCIFQPGNTNTQVGSGINLPYIFGLTSVTVNVRNSIIQGFSATGGRGVTITEADFTLNVYNSVITGNETGINQSAGIATLINCAIFNNVNDVSGTVTPTYCAGDDSVFGSGTGNIRWLNGATDWNANFTEYVSGDVSLKPTSPDLIDNGTDLNASGVIDDIIGTARPQVANFDIGAFEYVETASLVTLDGTISTTTNLAAQLNAAKSLSGQILSTSSTDALLSIVKSLIGDISIQSQVDVSLPLNISRVLNGSILSLSSTNANLDAVKGLSGNLSSVSQASGALECLRSLLGSINAVSSLSGDLLALHEIIITAERRVFLIDRENRVFELDREKRIVELDSEVSVFSLDDERRAFELDREKRNFQIT